MDILNTYILGENKRNGLLFFFEFLAVGSIFCLEFLLSVIIVVVSESS